MSDLSVWLANHPNALKDFAGPVSTVIAASVAAWVAVRLGRGQAAIAKSQADIAFDKLKFDLFERRYSIYLSLKELIEYASGMHPDAPIDALRVRNLYVKLDEARFFFDEVVTSFIDKVCATTEAYFNLRGARAIANPDDTRKWTEFAEKLAACNQQLRFFYAAAPAAFESSLRFDQMMKSSLRKRTPYLGQVDLPQADRPKIYF